MVSVPGAHADSFPKGRVLGAAIMAARFGSGLDWRRRRCCARKPGVKRHIVRWFGFPAAGRGHFPVTGQCAGARGLPAR